MASSPKQTRVEIDEKDIEQDNRINDIERRLEVMSAHQGQLSMNALGQLATIGSVIMILVGTAMGFWMDSRQAETKQELATAVSEIQTAKRDIATTTLELKEYEKAVDREVSDLSEDINETISEKVITNRFDTMNIRIDGVEGRFERIINSRIQPQLELLREALGSVQTGILREMENDRSRLQGRVEDLEERLDNMSN